MANQLSGITGQVRLTGSKGAKPRKLEKEIAKSLKSRKVFSAKKERD